MKPILRYQSQLLYRKAYKVNWQFKPRPVVKRLAFRPTRAVPAAKAA